MGTSVRDIGVFVATTRLKYLALYGYNNETLAPTLLEATPLHGVAQLATSMSTQTIEERTCPQCDYTGPDAHQMGSYCSTDCQNRSKGENLLESVVYDHRYCASCFTQLKNVRRAKESHPDCFIGFQYLSGDTLKGEKHVRLPGNHDQQERVIESHGTICGNCGATNHADTYLRENGLLDDEYSEVAKRLFHAIGEFRKEGQHEFRVDVPVFVEVWNESPGEWAKALGASLINE